MHICLYVDQSRLFRWHLWLAKALSALPRCVLTVRFSDVRHPLPKSCLTLFQAERVMYRLKGGNAIDPLDGKDILRFSQAQADPFDLLIDCATGDSSAPAARRTLVPCFDAVPGEIGAIAGLLGDNRFRIEIYDSAGSKPLVGYPAIDYEVFARSLDNALSCAVGLLVKAVVNSVSSAPSSGLRPSFAPVSPVRAAVALHTSTVVARKAARLLTNMVLGGKKWHVAWRFDSLPTLFGNGMATFNVLHASEDHYYADPFPFQYNGESFIFLEDFSMHTQRGRISVSKIENGCLGVPEPVLVGPYHLSYPFIFEYDGAIWMIPECGESRGIYLYRAERFPHRWVKEACIISEIEAYDATLLRRGDEFWLFLCERIYNSSSWDTLSLFHAADLFGPWIPVQNPVLFDVTSSRPAGAVFTSKGHYVRPVQDCSLQYGGAVQLYQIDTLGKNLGDAFQQTHIGTIHCGRYGCHTYNRHGNLEVIDFFGRRGPKEVTVFYSPVGSGQPLEPALAQS